jgi:signal peptidase
VTAALARGALRALALPALVAVLLIGAPRIIGWEAYALGSGSMQPAIAAGSVVVLRPVAAAEVRVGEVVAVRTAGGILVHRVVAITDGSLTLKGDANEVVDARAWPSSAVVGTVAYAVPLAGYAALTLNDPLLGSVPAMTLVLSLAVLARPRPQAFALTATLVTVLAVGTLAPGAAPFTAASAAGSSDVTTDVLRPASSLSGDAVRDGIALTWTASPSANIQYQVERCMGSGCTDFAPLTIVAATSHLDETVDRRTTYGYRVTAVYASWTSPHTSAVWVRAR